MMAEGKSKITTQAVLGFLAGIAAAVGYDRYLHARGGLSFTIVRLF